MTSPVVGCKEETAGAGSGGPAAAAATVAPKALTETIEGAKATLPAVYKGLSFGMTQEAAGKVNPALAADDDFKDPAYGRVSFNMSFDKKTKKLTRFYYSTPKDFGAALTKAWGEPLAGKDTIDRPEQYWFNPEAGVKATLKDGFGDEKTIEFTAYIAAANVVGAKGEPNFGFEAKTPVLGATIEALRAGYPEALVEKNQAEAEADRKRVEAMAGQKLDALGKAKPNAYLDLPPTEHAGYFTRVNLTFDDEGKVSRYRFGLDFRAFPDSKGPLFKLLEDKYGPATEGEKLGRKVFTFAGAPNAVEVQEDTITHKWDVTVEPKAP
jgi:hypothetical protein